MTRYRHFIAACSAVEEKTPRWDILGTIIVVAGIVAANIAIIVPALLAAIAKVPCAQPDRACRSGARASAEAGESFVSACELERDQRRNK